MQLTVGEVKATGKFVHPHALDNVKVGEAFAVSQSKPAASLSLQNQLPPVAILDGSPISKAGTFGSPDNAIEVVLNIEVQSKSDAESWSTRLLISATPSR